MSRQQRARKCARCHGSSNRVGYDAVPGRVQCAGFDVPHGHSMHPHNSTVSVHMLLLSLEQGCQSKPLPAVTAGSSDG